MGHFFAQIKLVVYEIYSQNSAMIKYSCNLHNLLAMAIDIMSSIGYFL